MHRDHALREMTDQPTTCGQGLAQHSVLPAALGALTAATVAVLDHHMKALDLTDGNAKQEYDAYQSLVAAHQEIAAKLQATAGEMAGYRYLPVGRHNEQVMASPDAVTTFARFVQAEQELLALLQTRLAQDRQMLDEMGGADAGGGF